MRASEVREAILAEHEQIRLLLSETDRLAHDVIAGRAGTAALRKRGQALYRKLVRHLAFEDRVLVPALRDADAWGEERARQLAEEHREQRALLDYVLSQLADRDRVARVLSRTLHSFVQVIRDDMAHEEAELLSDEILRDDVVGIAVEAG